MATLKKLLGLANLAGQLEILVHESGCLEGFDVAHGSVNG